MSVRLSTSVPAACSGLMYAGVPMTAPARDTIAVAGTGSPVAGIAVAGSRSMAARPKSSTFTVPSAVVMTLAGFRSRCTTPFSCAASSAAAIWLAQSSADATGIGETRVRPWTRSITSAACSTP